MNNSKIRRLAHQKASAIPKKDRRALVIEGCVGRPDSENFRHVVTTILTVKTDYGIVQTCGVAYVNPTPYHDHLTGDTPNFELGRKIALGQAELSLGLQLMMIEDGVPGIVSLVNDQLVNSTHRGQKGTREWMKS